MPLKTVRVPPGLEARFAEAERLVSRYFEQRRHDPEHGSIEIFGERYVMVRAASLSVEFFALVRDLYGAGREDEADDFARNILYDLAHAIGKSDAHRFHGLMKLEDPIERLTAGPVHFAHAGWAFVDIHPESEPSPDERYRLVYDHPYSFEASAWIEAGRESSFPVCIMNAGYSSGWCEESFGIPLVASELLCRARGDEACRFIMAPPARIEGLVAEYRKDKPQLAGRGSYQIPDFFARKRIEEELRRARDDLEARVEERTTELSQSAQRLREEIESRKKAEKQLLQTARLEAIGRLAGGIAHDFNNLMSVVIGHAMMIERRLPEDDPLRSQVGEIRKAGEHAAALTQQLLAFGRSQLSNREMVDVHEVVREMGRMLELVIGEAVELTTSCSEEPCRANVDRAQVTQVIMNLALNGRDAMPEGGTLRIGSSRVTVDESSPAGAHEVARGDWVVLEVEDSGEGMSDTVLAQAFDPFFTTKGTAGTGLGLPTVHGVVTRLGGTISISTVLGQGTRFRIYLPRAAEGAPSEDARRAASERPRSEPAPTGSPSILVVEDQTALRTMVTGFLEDLGYHVLPAHDAEEALRLADASQEPIGLLLTDVVMPGMSGRELADRFLHHWPEVPVLYMSGHTDDEILRRGVEQGQVDFIAKPFTPEQLAERVRRAMQG